MKNFEPSGTSLFIFFYLMLTYLLSVYNKYPITRDRCAVNINGSYYDLTGLAQRGVMSFSVPVDGVAHTGYLKLCDRFTDEDYNSGKIPKGLYKYKFYNFIICDATATGTCFPVASTFDTDYAPLNEKDFNKGVSIDFLTYPKIGVNSQQPETKYVYLKTSFQVECDPSQTNPNAEVQIATDIKHGFPSDIVISMKYSGACPQKVAVPAPTPMYSPQCDYFERDDNIRTQGVHMHLQDNNGGPYGHMIWDAIGRQDEAWIFYQPCERSTNPANKTDQTLASVWVCDADITKCTSYGVADDHMKISKTIYGMNAPIQNTLISDNGRQTIVYWACTEGMPENLMAFYDADWQSSDKYVLNMTLKSLESCTHSIPPPDVPENTCQLKYDEYNFNAKDLNGKTNVGYVTQVTVEEHTGLKYQARLHYQPCGTIFCPDDAKCDQFEDAFIWICQKVSLGSTPYQCKPYGLGENNISTSFVDPTNFHSGIQIKYKGGDALNAVARFHCNEKLDPKAMQIDNTIETLSQTTLAIDIMTKQACGTSPTPEYYFTPSWPVQGKTPTPTPLAHPQTSLFYRNETHYINVALDQAERDVDIQEFDLAWRSKRCHITHYYSPFGNWSCPEGYDCKEYSDLTAAGWLCYKDNDKKVCFPDAIITNYIDMFPINKKRLDDGVSIVYSGVQNIDLEVNVRCAPDATWDIPLTDSPSYGFNTRTGGQEISFGSVSKMSCPKAFTQPRWPNVKPTATPDPAVFEKIDWDQDFDEDGHNVELDMTRIPPSSSHNIALGAGLSPFEDVNIFYSPIDRIPCPDGYSCPGMEKGNIWKCWKNTTGSFCYVIGNAEYGVTMELAPNLDYIHADVAATYYGGANGARSTILFVCNHSVPMNQVWMAPVGIQRFAGPAAVGIFYLHTKNVCWDVHPYTADVTGGAIFLTLLAIGGALYFAGGAVVLFFLKGTVSVPQQEFWVEFALCVKTAVIFLATCGKKTVVGNASYDAI